MKLITQQPYQNNVQIFAFKLAEGRFITVMKVAWIGKSLK